ncbi:hypothetical protein FB45DRAFT_1006174 [Roridomyces roridus]|uniref:Zn(2)-C6 fungal-type domain-containing protein n=1 Tax=Roridomyces roridus TaxID=1738132 RepID=A0AAD7FJ83_9AGAR|nr:hypothetical protein FB45DRAFT_1006174 [Roridomyces roridus]
MDSSSSSTSPPLQRGQACTNCRRRKIKCDGRRPTCDSCRLHPPRSRAPCVFDSAPDMHLQARIRFDTDRKAEAAEDDPSNIRLSQPYMPPDVSGKEDGPVQSDHEGSGRDAVEANSQTDEDSFIAPDTDIQCVSIMILVAGRLTTRSSSSLSQYAAEASMKVIRQLSDDWGVGIEELEGDER